MLLHLKNLLSKDELERVQAQLGEGAPWRDGRSSAGGQALVQKNNQQLAQDSDAAQQLQAVVLAAVEGQGIVTLRAQAVARAVENLIGNAVRHGTRAEVSVTVTERSLRITVEDDGPGIPPDKRDEAMTAFARLDDARDPNRGGGVGLGLTIAADIARSHGGSLRLGESARLGGLRADLTLMR